MKSIRVGILDTGIDSECGATVVAERAFMLDDKGDVIGVAARDDLSGHGTRLAQIIAGLCPDAVLINAQVFTDRNRTTPAAIAAGLLWLIEQRANIVTMSFGLREDRAVLRSACERAHNQGMTLVAATPAQGGGVFPASYPDVIRVTGDARCAGGELSALNNQRADFGACPGLLDHVPHTPGGGSSLAVAHVCGVLAHRLSTNVTATGSYESEGTATSVKALLNAECRYLGEERR